MATKTPPTSRLAVRYLDDDILLSATDAWTYVQIPLTPYEFLSADTRTYLASQITLAYAALVTSSQETVEAHLRVVHRPFDTFEWATKLNERVNRQQPTPGWLDNLTGMATHVDSLGFTTKEVYLGVHLGRRNTADDNFNPLAEIIKPFKKFVSATERLAQYEDDQISAKELERWRTKAHEVRRTLNSGHLNTRGATAEQVAWVIANPLWPGMEQPPLANAPGAPWGSGNMRQLAESDIINHRRWLQINQIGPDGEPATGYVAVLAVSRFPDSLVFPAQEPWMHMVAQLPYPIGFSTRFTIVPPQKVQKDIGKKLADAKDQVQHIAESGTAVPLKVREQLEVATQLEYLIDKERMPWAYARHRIIVTGDSESELSSRCRRIIEMYRELGIDVAWPTGDQFELLLEITPGDKVHGRSYYQRQDLAVIAGGMATASSEVGDNPQGGKGWRGAYLGYTTSRVASPVFFAPHVAMARNRPPGVCITGAPGGGKSFLAFTIAYQMASQGVWTVYIDPKADAKPMGAIPGLGSPRVFDLRDGNDGMLDPFSLGATKSEATLLALETIRLLLGGNVSEEREEALLNAVERVSNEPSPSLSRVVDALVTNQHSASARNLGAVLRTIRDLPFARLCFSPTGGRNLRPEDGLTVVTLLGLDLPDATTKPEDYSYENRLAVSVMYLLTRYARRLMLNLDKSHPKAICIDEAWAITSTTQGAKLIPEVARMGRSHNTALVLVSQNAGDLMAESVTNSLSTKFAFRSTIPNEIDDIVTLFGLDSDEGYNRVLRGLRDGECVMQDVDGRVARVQVDAWNAALFDTFNTNPETRGKAGGR